jgi:hypothetical protein
MHRCLRSRSRARDEMLLGGLRASARQTLADGRNSSGARTNAGTRAGVHLGDRLIGNN